MSANIKYVRSTPELIEIVAQNMRKADIVEVMASHGYTPIQALTGGIALSDFSAVILYDDEPVAAVGLVLGTLLSGYGTPWLLGTDRLFSLGKSLTKHSMTCLQEMLDECSYLQNYVHAENKRSIQWLKRLGFEFENPEPYGVNGELFHRFYMRRD